jgi:subfamily B ATP-binding cassette protein MsbA
MVFGLILIAEAVGIVTPRIMGYWIDELSAFDQGPKVTAEGVCSLCGQPLPHTTSAPATDRPAPRTQQAILALLLTIAGLLAGLRVGRLIISYGRSMLLAFVGMRLIFDMRQRLYRHLQRLSLRFYERKSTGRIMSHVLYDVDSVQSFVRSGLVDILTNSIQLVAVLVYAIIWKPSLAIIPCIALPLYALNYMMFRKRIRHASMDQRDKYSDIYSVLQEGVSGVKVVKSFVREASESRRFVGEIREHFGLSMRLRRLSILLHIGSDVITGAAYIAVLWFGGRQVILTNTMSVGDLVAFSAYLGMLYGPVRTIIRSNDTLQRVWTALERIFELLDTLPEVQENKEATRLEQIEGRVEFENVSFWYEPGQTVLHNIGFVAEPGKTIALVGPSGGGKSTLVNLISRFYDPAEGRVLMDGHDLRDLQIASLRSHIGIVLQETFLFSGTLRENIKYGKAKGTDEEVMSAAIAANAHDFIMEFPEGYETEIGERGVRLSGGQKQRVSIARAILRNPKILILDEATSSLDSQSEALIHEALDDLMKNRTTFVIAHRLSTVMNADEILVIDEGRIIERGTHDELVNAGGLYQRLCKVQFKDSERILASRPDEEDG